MRKELYPL